MSFRITVKVPMQLVKEIKSLRQEAARVVATMVEGVFIDLLYIAPQYSGNYVANLAIAAGSAIGRKGGERVFPIPRDVTEAVARGSSPAIEYAMSQNEGMVRSLTSNISFASSWIPSLTIYNRLDYAEYVEEWEEENLRLENKGGAHAMQQAEEMLRSKFSQPMLYGSPSWKAAVMGNKL